MKRYLILFLACLVVFGSISNIYCEEKSLAQLLSDAEAALRTANEHMEALELELNSYETEHNTITGDAPEGAIGMITQGISLTISFFFTSQEILRLIELDLLIADVYIQIETLNIELRRLADARDAAYETYVDSVEGTLSPREIPDKGGPPEYGELSEWRLPCNNACGTVWSSNDHGYGNLTPQAANGHRSTCALASDLMPGCGVGYWTCI